MSDVDTVIADYKAGYTIRVIAKRHRIGRSTVAQHLKSVGKQIRQQRKQALIDAIIEMRAQGMKYEAIGEVLGYTTETLRDKMTRYRRSLR